MITKDWMGYRKMLEKDFKLNMDYEKLQVELDAWAAYMANNDVIMKRMQNFIIELYFFPEENTIMNFPDKQHEHDLSKPYERKYKKVKKTNTSGYRGDLMNNNELEFNYTWEMPSKWTFTMKSVKRLLEKYNVGQGWCDPFAGENSPAELANDIEGRGNNFQMDGLEFLKSLEDNSLDGAVFDPPYSTEQCLRLYTPKHNGTAGRAEYWAKCKDEIKRIVKRGGLTISFAWDSVGMGKKRGFEKKEISLICHGACHNDTIITVEKKK